MDRPNGRWFNGPSKLMLDQRTVQMDDGSMNRPNGQWFNGRSKLMVDQRTVQMDNVQWTVQMDDGSMDRPKLWLYTITLDYEKITGLDRPKLRL